MDGYTLTVIVKITKRTRLIFFYDTRAPDTSVCFLFLIIVELSNIDRVISKKKTILFCFGWRNCRMIVRL